MGKKDGWPVWSDEKGIASMDTNHIQNTIALIKRKWDDLPDEDDHLVADHWSLTSVVFEPGKPWFKERLQELKKELSQRLAETTKTKTGVHKNALGNQRRV